ncbi:hypothetical protein FE394_00615 [Xenorhabdus sp. Reich]|uniref:DNA-binding protein n=1 Tax=Xenorhabdus littoralis TaxID=2582835 RepID=A0ABU4SGF2_9GAMM|nr:hypothetical protein [Xenorhabdus sp. Reich]MDX7997736.1 hypothetical protein [Xenorhabdus sp. Reich]
MNTKIKEINIYLSKLISNPKYSIKMHENPHKFMIEHDISKENKELIINFFKINGDKFVKSSILQKIRRMDGLISALPILYSYLGKEKFECKFEEYFINLSFNDNVKKNPIFESVFFCRHIIKNTKDNIIKSIALYEKEKNKIIINLEVKTSDNEKENNGNEIENNEIPEALLISNPTIRIIKFNIDILSLLSDINKNTSKENYQKKSQRKKSKVLFYRKENSNKVISLSIGNIIHHIILKSKKPILVSELLEKTNELFNIDEGSVISTLKILKEKKLISFNKKVIHNEKI